MEAPSSTRLGRPFLQAAQSVSPGTPQQDAAPIERRSPPAAAAPTTPQPPKAASPPNLHPGGPLAGSNPGGMNGRRGQHLAEWMNQHSGLTLEQQERALEREPGFSELPIPTQQRMRGRLAELNEMSPQQRQRIIAHTEAMERLTVDQRSQVRAAMQQLSALPIDQRKMVSRSFRELRVLPPNQRMAAVYSPQYAWLNAAQRSTLTRLIQVAPMLPQQ